MPTDTIPIPAIEAIAIDRFIASCTTPLILETTEHTEILGTGTFFRSSGRSFLITASHLFEKGVDVNKIAVPLSPVKADLWTLGNAELFYPNDSFYDIAVLELKNKSLVEQLQQRWTFLSPANIAMPAKNHRWFIVGGFPCALSRTTPSEVRGMFADFYTTPLPGVPEQAMQPVDLSVDLFLHYGRDGEKLDGTDLATPKLHGVSGASVWALSDTKSAQVWSPEHQLRIVAIQVAFVHSTYIRTKKWTALVALFDQIDANIAQELRSTLQLRS